MADPRIGTSLGGYRILSLVGRGGMGVVYLAEHTILQRRAAIKVIAPELADDPVFRQRFLDESRLAASIDHPNIVPIYEAGEAEGALFIAMRYVDGQDLQALIRSQGPMSVDRVVALLGPIASALDAAHAVGLVHRDVKAANILVDSQTNRPFLTDFGITKHTWSKSGLTRTGQLVGSPEYMAPEQVTGGPIDGRADQYSLACIAFEGLTGHVPHERETDMAALYARVNTDPPDPRDLRPDLPSAVGDVLRRGLAKEPSNRFPDCGSFIAALGRAAHSPAAASPAIMPAGQPGGSGWPFRTTGTVVGLAAAAVVIVLVALSGALGVGPPQPTQNPSQISLASAAPTTAVDSPSQSGLTPSPSDTPSTTPGASPSATAAPTPRPPTPHPPTPHPPTSPPDTIAPVVAGPPTHVFVANTQVSASGYAIKVKVVWSGSDSGGSGLKEYILEKRQTATPGSGTWVEVYRGKTASVTLTLTGRLNYTFRVSARDNALNLSAVKTGNEFLLFDYEDDHSQWTPWAAGWTSAAVSGAIDGFVETCSTMGAIASITLNNVSSLGFVFSTGGAYGSIQIKVGGVSIGTFNLASGPGLRTVVAMDALGSAVDGLTITVATTSSAEVQLDALFVQHGEPK